jgi:DNA-binding PadR family transcriptional regulator
MATLWTLSKKRPCGFLSIYVLYTLKQKPKSGYEILSELKEKGSNGLSPSKGSLYPLLKSLDDQGLIKLQKTGLRSKNTYEITPKGKKELLDFRKEKEMMNERFSQFQRLFADILGEHKVNTISLLLEIRKVAMQKNDEKTIQELKSCLEKIKKL